MRYVDDDYCFGCGTQNPIGLRINFDVTEEGVKAIVQPKREFQGYRNMLHGGLMMTMLDEALAWSVDTKYGHGVTAEITIRIRNYGQIDTPMTLIGKTTKRRLRMVEGESFLLDQDNKVIAQATGKFMLSNEDDKALNDERKSALLDIKYKKDQS
jgi:acyl-coenzyme A thioesterase PaaI-like protein